MLEFLKIVLIGIVEGITEWLPVSSTGHMLILESVLAPAQSAEFMDMFRTVIQLGAICAVIVHFFNRLWPFRFKAMKKEGGAFYDKDKFIFWSKIIISCLPGIIIGLPLDDFVDAKLYNPWVIASMLIIYGIGFIIVENMNRQKPHILRAEAIGYKEAFIIGMAQLLALIPGTSRSGVTIIAGLLIGLSRRAAIEYTFFLAVPVMLGTSAIALLKFGSFSGLEFVYLFVGMATAFIVSLFVIKQVLKFIRTHSFKVFGYYRIFLGIIIIIYFLIKR